MSTISSERLFVIACPACRGHVATADSLCGRAACCPLCASLFLVPPLPETEKPAVVATPSAALAEDWGRVIETLAPPPPKNGAPAEAEHPSDFELPAASPSEGPMDLGGPAAHRPGEAASPSHPPAESVEALTLPEVSPSPPAADWIDSVLASSQPDEFTEPSAAPEGVSFLGTTPASPDADVEFREPVRTIRRGDTVVEIRRLTPEERRARRFRRNLMMIVIGVSILMAIVVIFGVPTKPPR